MDYVTVSATDCRVRADGCNDPFITLTTDHYIGVSASNLKVLRDTRTQLVQQLTVVEAAIADAEALQAAADTAAITPPFLELDQAG